MPYLRNLKIFCEKTQEAVDEPFLKLTADPGTLAECDYGQWGPFSMDDGETRTVHNSYAFSHTYRVELWEKDITGSDDHFGSITIDDTPGEHSQLIRKTDYPTARYRLSYKVVTEIETTGYFLNLRLLRCMNAQELQDKPYLVVNGDIVWGPGVMRTDDAVSLDIHLDFSLHGSITIELWERDLARSDRIGDPFVIDPTRAEMYVRETEAFTNEHDNCSHQFHSTSVTYVLGFRMRRGPLAVP